MKNFVVVLLLLSTLAEVNAQSIRRNKTGATFQYWDITLVKNKPFTTPSRLMTANVSHTYAFKAKKGEALKAQLVSKSNTTFRIIGAGNTVLGEPADEDWSWEGSLPQTDEYRVVVVAGADQKSAPYVLKLTLK